MKQAAESSLSVDAELFDELRRGRLATPDRVLGPQVAAESAQPGVRIRGFHPDAVRAEFVPARGQAREMTPEGGGLFSLLLPQRSRAPRYRLRYWFADGASWELDDPYRFPPVLDADELATFHSGKHRRLWRLLGAHPCKRGTTSGTRFAVWAPNAIAVHLVGEFCAWDGRLLPMQRRAESGVFELFVPGVDAGAAYKFEIVTPEGALRLKTDPMAFELEPPKRTNSRVVADSSYRWSDQEWMKKRRRRDLRRAPVSIYEVHLGSWDRRDGDASEFLSYREIAPRLIAHCQRFGFTHIELLPIAAHAFYGSWGYQVMGYYAPTTRYGTADDLRYLVDQCHQHGIGVFIDWVPSHFPKDDYALRRFDGRPIYEIEDSRYSEHPDWGTLVFDYGRPEVRSFLISNAMYWLREFHFDGLRVDAVSWMLRLDYGRSEGEWEPNELGGNENLGGISLLQELNDLIHAELPGAVTFAEEATSWPGVTAETSEGGLGFTFKWNMGWMNDTLGYFATDPIERKHHQNRLTFAMTYESSERFVNPLSHDEVVHLKKSLLSKMPGDTWQQFANLRLLLAYQFTRPGKKLLFMGTELAPSTEWNHDEALDWSLWSDPMREQFATYLAELGRLYSAQSCLWRRDPDRATYAWIDGSDHERSVVSYVRRDGNKHLVVVLNLTPVPREAYRVGVPSPGRYLELMSTDDERYGGSIFPTRSELPVERVEFMGWSRSTVVDLPPLGALILAPKSTRTVQVPPPGAVP